MCVQLLVEYLGWYGARDSLVIIPYISTQININQDYIFKELNSRKCLISTNISETSVTIENVHFVIDCGLQKLNFYNPVSGIE